MARRKVGLTALKKHLRSKFQKELIDEDIRFIQKVR